MWPMGAAACPNGSPLEPTSHPRTLPRWSRLARSADVAEELAAGGVSFDRAVATAGLRSTDAHDHVVDASTGLDIAGVRALTARWRRITRVNADRGLRVPSDRHPTHPRQCDVARLVPTLRHRRQDPRECAQPAGRCIARRPRDVTPAATRRCLDRHCPRHTRWRRWKATAPARRAGPHLSACSPTLTSWPPPRTKPGSEIAGRTLEPGSPPWKNSSATGSIEWIQRHPDGRFLGVGRKTRVIPGPLRRAVMARDGGCVADGCQSRYRLQVHHVISWLDGGETEPDNLVTVCWYHHHVVIHGRGQAIDPESPPGRVRFVRRDVRGPPLAA